MTLSEVLPYLKAKKRIYRTSSPNQEYFINKKGALALSWQPYTNFMSLTASALFAEDWEVKE